ncbi:MAG: hypothetical protein IJ907_01890 [Prevotella sp.]|nr:hypothetical protein [Prevotella sp.]MBR2096628.1 hypothetical protein [Prevotella sp.]
MRRYVKVDELLDALNSQDLAEWLDKQDEYTPADIVEHALETLSTADAVPVIRCKDCKFAHLIEPHDDWWECEHDKRVLHSDGFCSWAERREE